MLQQTYIVLDTETTGFSPEYGDRIVEVAAIKILNGEIQSKNSFSTLINPQRPIPPGATRIHKISDSMVQQAPEFKDIAEQLHEFCQNTDYIFMHNAKFDLRFF